MKIIAITIWLGLLTQSGISQFAFSYSPDSTALSIILEKIKLDSANHKFKLDLKNKWNFKNADS